MKIKNKFYKIAGLVIVIVIVIIISLGAWLTIGNLTPAKEKIFRVLPSPAALVNGKPVAISLLLDRYGEAIKLSAKNAKSQPDDDLKAKVFDELLAETKMNELASSLGLPASKKQIDDEYQLRQAEFAAQGMPKLDESLKTANLSQAEYKNGALKAEVAAANLSAWFYGQRELNQSSYQKADSVLAQLAAGTEFNVLSDANAAGQTGNTSGDLGFMRLDQILPEMRGAVDSMKIGDSKIAPNRYGIEIIRLLQTNNDAKSGNTEYHLQHIFLLGSDFETWYKEKIKNYKTIKIINF